MNVCNAKIKNTEDKIPNITNLATNTSRNTKINKAKNEIPSITKSATTATLNAKINEARNEIPTIIIKLLSLLLKIKYLTTTPEFNKLTAETFARD